MPLFIVHLLLNKSTWIKFLERKMSEASEWHERQKRQERNLYALKKSNWWLNWTKKPSFKHLNRPGVHFLKASLANYGR